MSLAVPDPVPATLQTLAVFLAGHSWPVGRSPRGVYLRPARRCTRLRDGGGPLWLLGRRDNLLGFSRAWLSGHFASRSRPLREPPGFLLAAPSFTFRWLSSASHRALPARSMGVPLVAFDASSPGRLVVVKNTEGAYLGSLLRRGAVGPNGSGGSRRIISGIGPMVVGFSPGPTARSS